MQVVDDDDDGPFARERFEQPASRPVSVLRRRRIFAPAERSPDGACHELAVGFAGHRLADAPVPGRSRDLLDDLGKGPVGDAFSV